MKTKTISSGSLNGAKGGSAKMFSKMGVQPSSPGVSAPTSAPRMDKAPPKGGRTGVMGKQGGSIPAEAGKITPAKSGVGNSSGFSVAGGKTRMYGKGTAAPAKPL